MCYSTVLSSVILEVKDAKQEAELKKTKRKKGPPKAARPKRRPGVNKGKEDECE